MAEDPSIRRRRIALVRMTVSVIVGIAVGFAVTPWLGLAAALLAGWAALALTSTIWVLVVVWPMDAVATRTHATAENPGRSTARLIALIGSLASLGAVVVVLLEAAHAPDPLSFVLAFVSVLSVAASWALIQVDYMLRIAAEYYAHPIGGIDFHQVDDPMYTDFIYVSVGLGMTYQIADTDLGTNRLRRIVIGQTLLAYLFGAVILATVINLVTSLG